MTFAISRRLSPASKRAWISGLARARHLAERLSSVRPNVAVLEDPRLRGARERMTEASFPIVAVGSTVWPEVTAED